MNLSEFKAWFEGYTENMKDAPTAKQWARIKARVAEIKPQPTEVRCFYDHYRRPHYGYSYGGVAGLKSGDVVYYNSQNAANSNAVAAAYAAAPKGLAQQATGNGVTSLDAFKQLGRMDHDTEIAA